MKIDRVCGPPGPVEYSQSRNAHNEHYRFFVLSFCIQIDFIVFDNSIEHIHDHEHKFKDMMPLSVFSTFHYQKAVDGNEDTCWHSFYGDEFD